MILSLTAAFAGTALLTGAWYSLRPVGTPPGAAPDMAPGEPPPLPAGWSPYAGARPEIRGWPDETILAARGLDKHPPEVRRALLEVCERLHAPVDTVAAVLAHESGWNPGALYFRDKNDDGTPRKVPFVAAGLCQLTVAAHLEGFGDWEKVKTVAGWSAERQLREVVGPLWAKFGARVHRAHPGYGLMLNFLPDQAGGPEDRVLGEKGAPGFSGKVYAMNTGLDVNGDGKVTIADVYASAARVCRGAKGRRLRLDGSVWTPAASRTVAPAAIRTAAPGVGPGAPGAPAGDLTDRPNSPAQRTAAPDGSPPLPSRTYRLSDSSGGLLLAAIRERREEPPTWVDLPWEGRGRTAGIKLVLRVSAHAVRAPLEIEGLGKRLLRLPISYQEQIEVRRLRGWLPLTQSISDAIWFAARRLDPVVLGKWGTAEEAAESSRRMRTLEWVVELNHQLDRQIPPEGWGRLWAPEGKDWILHPRIAERADGTGAVNYGLHRRDGAPWQPPGGKHDWTHFDYSQVLRALDPEATDATTGKKVSLVEVLRTAGMPDAVLAPLEKGS